MVNLPSLLKWWNPWPRCWCCLARVQNVCHIAHCKSLKGQKRKKFNVFDYSKSVYGRHGMKLTFKGPLVQFKIQIIDLPVDLGSSDPLYQISRNLSIKTPSSHLICLCINCELYLIFLKQNSLHWFCRPVSWLRSVSWVSAGKRCAPAASPFLPCKYICLHFRMLWNKQLNLTCIFKGIMIFTI